MRSAVPSGLRPGTELSVPFSNWHVTWNGHPLCPQLSRRLPEPGCTHDKWRLSWLRCGIAHRSDMAIGSLRERRPRSYSDHFGLEADLRRCDMPCGRGAISAGTRGPNRTFARKSNAAAQLPRSGLSGQNQGRKHIILAPASPPIRQASLRRC